MKKQEQYIRNISRTKRIDSLREMLVSLDPLELLVGNRTPEIRAGVVFPEAGISLITSELEALPTRPQDPNSLINLAYNEELIASYMAWEKENAIKQIAEIMELKKENKKII